MQSDIPMPDHIKITHQAKFLEEATKNVGFGAQTKMNLPDDEWIKKSNEKIPPTNANLRAQFLADVEKLVCVDRNVTHGDAEDNFRVIADLWNVYLRNSKCVDNTDDLNNKDVAIMMCLFKISRLMTNVYNMENWLDLAGYAACGGGIVKKTVVNTY
jgi:hypothetical protein